MKRPTTPLTPDQLFREEIVSALKRYYGDGYKPILKKNVCFSNSFDKLTVMQVTQAVAVMATALDFPGASGLYEIVQAVLLDEEKRKEIQALLKGWMPPSKAYG